MNVLAVHHPIVTGLLVWVAVGLAIVCCVGLAVMRDAMQRLHFSAIVVVWSVPLVVVAVWIENPDWQARIKSVVIALVLFMMNSVLTHATARAIRIRQARHLEPRPGEGIETPRKG